jgi:hypothetical protein
MSEKKEIVINEHVVDLADKIKKHIEISKDNIVNVKDEKKDDESLFASLLPEDIALKDVKKVFNAVNDFTAATGLAFGEKAIDHMKKHKDCDALNVNFNIFGNNRVEHTLHRTKTGQIPGKPGETYTKSAVLQTGIKITATKKSGDLGKVVKTLEEQGAEILLGNKK